MQIKNYFLWAIFFCTVASSAQVVKHTEINTFKPVLPTNAKIVSGSCWTSSIAVNRSNAWRCTVGNAIHDPCFTTSNKNQLVCDADPVLHKTGFILQLTKPLPEPNMKTTVVNPWILQLADGSVCKPYTGTMPITDKGGIAFYCYHANEKPNPTAKCYTGLLADSVKQGKVWTATLVTYCSSPQSQRGLAAQKVEQVPVKTVWQ